MNKNSWIQAPIITESEVLTFQKTFSAEKDIEKATLCISAIGIYHAEINGRAVTDSLFNPGQTNYYKRTQYQEYDITALLGKENEISVGVGNGWPAGYFGFTLTKGTFANHSSLIAELTIIYTDGTEKTVETDESWQVYTSKTEFAEIYHGETINLCHEPKLLGNALLDSEAAEKFTLIPHEGEWIKEEEHLRPIRLIITPKGEHVVDFGQNMTGYVELKIKGNRGDRIVFTHAEVLDKEGNFYTDNYRGARNRMTYILDGKENIFKPKFSFQGFRYIRFDEYPGEIDLNGITAVVVHSQMERTGYFTCGNEKVNQLYHNTVWGQKSNYLDVPTDCPQRNERLGWTGDAQVFCRTAALNFNVKKFLSKWLGDLRADQGKDGGVYGICPNRFGGSMDKVGPFMRTSAAWGDAATVIPWELYRAYGDKNILEDNFELMLRWVEYQHSAGSAEFLWLGGYHFGDWLAMDAGGDSLVGATSNDLIASAFFYYSATLLIKAGEALGKDMSQYKALKENIYHAFRAYFMENGMPKAELPYTEEVPEGKTPADTVRKGMTQTALVLILHFELYAEHERKALEDKLVSLIEEWDGLMTTGFVGTPYLLHVLTNAGRTDIAYKLLLEERTPSWLYSVNHGATTMWEHWNGVKEDGSFWDKSMNSFNHYAYGSVFDWVYGQAAGITVTDEGAGYEEFTLTPHPCKRLGFVNCTLNTPKGQVISNWYYKGEEVYYEFTVPNGSKALLTLPDGRKAILGCGKYMYVSKD